MTATAPEGQHPSELDEQTREAIYRATYEDLPTFTDLIFSQSLDVFTRGDWVLNRCQFLQSNNRTCFVGPRRHFKSTGFYAHWMWKLWRARFNALDGCEWAEGRTELEGQFFSYKKQSAGYHIGQAKDSIKALIDRNPWFDSIEDEKPQAETKGMWSWDGENTHTLDPHGMLSHTRGINADIIYVDDPFQDPENELNPTVVLKINYIFKSNVVEIPTQDSDELHISTTPQTDQDFTFDEALLKDYAYQVQPAIESHSQEQVIWPERMDYQDLMDKKEQIGPKLFNQEFMCSPKSSEVGFFREEEVEQMAVANLTDYGDGRDFASGQWECPWQNLTGVIGGLDIGKKRHPSHLAVFAVLPRQVPDKEGKLSSDKAGHLVQIHSKWMDGWDYTRQVEYCRKAIDYFGIDSLPYDNTRGEYESLDEMGQVPSEMKPVTLSGKTNSEMAGYLDVFAGSGRVKLLKEGRQNRQLTVVTNDLDAVETNEGHGESFFSIGLALMESQQKTWGSSFGALEM